jgi:hypothetical protein
MPSSPWIIAFAFLSDSPTTQSAKIGSWYQVDLALEWLVQLLPKGNVI